MTNLKIRSDLADSGTHHGVKTAKSKGAEVAIHNILQSPKNQAIQGRILAANVKNNAIDMLATNVLHFGPTYSSTKT